MKKYETKNLIEAYNAIVYKVAEFARDLTTNDQIEDGLDEFFGVSEAEVDDQYLSIEQEECFWEWFWCDAPTLGKTIIESYITEHDESLTEQEVDYLLGMQKSYRSCFKVVKMRKDGGFELLDMFTGQNYIIYDDAKRSTLKLRDTIYARLIPLKDMYVLSGTYYVMKRINFEAIEKSISIEHMIVAPNKSIRDFLKRDGGVLFQALFD